MQFSKLVLAVVMILYFVAAVFGAFIVYEDHDKLGEYLAFIGAPTATAIGFYAWKAKAENVIKITKDVEKDKKIPEKTRQQLISGIAKTISEIETE